MMTESGYNPCMLKDFGNGNSVCVCNSTYCDTVPPLPKFPSETAAVYSSSQAGDRLAFSTAKFTSTAQGC